MKSSILQKLEHLRDRYEEVGHLLAEPDAANDQERFRRLSKEYAELETVAHTYTAYEQAQADIQEAMLLAQDADPDMRAMGEEEVNQSPAGPQFTCAGCLMTVRFRTTTLAPAAGAFSQPEITSDRPA